MIKGVKPRTHFTIDSILFALFVTVTMSKLIELAIPEEMTHAQFMFHCMHGVAGVILFLGVSTHLLLHLPWIEAQFKRRIQSMR